MTPAELPPESFETVIALLLEHLPESVVGCDAATKLMRCARQLPLLVMGGFEYRLEGSSDQVDFHQYWERETIPQLCNYLARQQGAPFDHPVWRRCATLLARLSPSASDSLYEEILGLFLEFDGVTDDVPDNGAYLPSLFIAFEPQRPAGNYETALRSLECLYATPFSHLSSPSLPSAAFQRCFELQSASSYWISHLGMMLAPPNAPFRLNLQMKGWEAIIPSLQELGWQGNFGVLSSLLAWLPEYVDRCTVALDVNGALDVAGAIYPHIGLELFLSPNAQLPAATGRFVKALVDRGIVQADKGEGLLGEVKRITPLNSKIPWPDSLILQALADPQQRLSMLVLKLSHVKLTLSTDGKIASKGYLAFGQKWLPNEADQMVKPKTEERSMAHESS